MDDPLRKFMEDLRLFATLVDPETVGLSEAGQLIDGHIQAIRDAIHKAAETAQDHQRKYWDGVEEIISSRLPRGTPPEPEPSPE